MKWHESAKQEQFARPSRWPWVIALMAVTVGGVFVVTRGGSETPEPTPDELIPLVAIEQQAGVEPAPPTLPPTQVTDAVIRDLLGDLFPLADTGDLVRRFVSAVNQIADGENPRAQLELLAPKGGFRVGEREGQVMIDERSHRRYDVAADLIGALDPPRAAAVFRGLEPILNRTHQELGARDRTFRETLAVAIDRLVQTPIPDSPIRLRRVRMFYAFADPSLEELSSAQKQLLRMGPRNARIVQSSLRDIAAALELPPARQHARLP